jgi:hypothetical protein
MCSFHGKLLRPTAGTADDLECHTRTNHHSPVIASQAALAQRGRLPTCAPPLGLLSVVAVTIALSPIELFRWPADPDRGAVGPERRKRLDRTRHCEEPSTRPLCRCGTTPPLVQACTPETVKRPSGLPSRYGRGRCARRCTPTRASTVLGSPGLHGGLPAASQSLSTSAPGLRPLSLRGGSHVGVPSRAC